VICTECVDDDGSLSADARFLVRQDPDTGDLNLLDLVTRQARPIGVKGTGSITQQFAELPVLSPDARFVVYRWIDRDRKLNQLRVFDTQAGGQPRVLIDDPLADFEPQDWRHDEKAVLVMITHAGGASDLEWVPIDGGPATVLTSFAAGVGVRRRARVSPDGRYAAYTRRTVPTTSNTFVFVFDLESRTETPVVTTADDNRAPVWSGTTRLLYMSDTAGRFDLWSVRVEGGHAADSPVLESHDIGDHIVPMGAASGAYYYVKVDAGLDLTFIASVNAGRADMSTIRTHFVGYQPIWSPDGDSIAFYRHKGAGKEADLIVRSVETGRERVLHTSASTLPLFWFSDGRTLLEQIGGDGKNRPALNHVDVSTGASARIGWDLPAGLTRSPEAALSHDGRTLYSVAHDASSRTGGWDRVIAIDLVTGAIRLVCALAGPPDTLPGSGGVAVALSPDPESSTIAIAAGNTRHGTRLVRVKTDGSGYRELYGPYRSDSPYQKIAWSKDGRSIFFSMTLPGVFAGKTWQVMGVDANTGLLTWPVTDAIAGSDQGATFDLSRNKSRLAIHPNPGASQKFNPAAGPHTELRRIFLSSRK
jgi:Tol biopolymer transport system component